MENGIVRTISYSGVVADFFHYGHLQAIKFAQSLADYYVCGLMTDEAVEQYRVRPLSNFEERKAVVESLKGINQIMVQHKRDCTDNLKKIHEQFPDAEIILVYGEKLSEIGGEEYVKSIGGRVVKHPYYSRLSNFKVINYLLENRDKFKDIKTFSSLINEGNTTNSITNKAIISSKADTLKALQPILTKSYIEPMHVFTFSDWKTLRAEIVDNIQKEFNGKIVVRSSSTTEDTLESSMAGCFESVLNIDSSDKKEIEKAVEKVINSFSKKEAVSSFNQILVQKQTEDIVMSGVVFTRTLIKNSPYYVINYDDQTGSSDSVTSGKENKVITISHFHKPPEKFKQVVEAVKEIENLIPNLPLDIEFALSKNNNNENKVVIFQTRPLAANLNKPKKDNEIEERLEELKEKFQRLNQKNHLAGKRTIFADMPDWNPAEIIGDSPNYLDYSLYDYLITNAAWHEARTSQGYYNVNPAKLVELFGNKPYVNVRNTFNSFTPAKIESKIRERLVEFYLDKLQINPHLQDKVEFEILFTCFDLNFNERIKELENDFFPAEIEEIKASLLNLTNNLVLNSSKDIQTDMEAVRGMEKRRINIVENVKEGSVQEKIIAAKELLNDCRRNGTVQFSRLARLGFIAKILLKSLVQQNIIDISVQDKIMNSIKTVASEINDDFHRLIENEITKEEFLKLYYHLRPGTYDITSLRYDRNPNLLKNINFELKKAEKDEFEINKELAGKITKEFNYAGLSFDADHFLNFVKEAIVSRELSKFEFTKNLSDAMELIASAGEMMGFSRMEISRLDINEILSVHNLTIHEITKRWKNLIKAKEKEIEINDYLNLPAIIFSEEDFYIIEHYDAKPNFITQKSVESKIVHLKEIDDNIPNIEGSIVVLENGDPGYDWIFTRNPAGLITKYGGVASHMSIRCAEFGIPAAIGCGENIFNKIKNVERVMIDCKGKKIEVK